MLACDVRLAQHLHKAVAALNADPHNCWRRLGVHDRGEGPEPLIRSRGCPPNETARQHRAASSRRASSGGTNCPLSVRSIRKMQRMMTPKQMMWVHRSAMIMRPTSIMVNVAALRAAAQFPRGGGGIFARRYQRHQIQNERSRPGTAETRDNTTDRAHHDLGGHDKDKSNFRRQSPACHLL